MYIEIDIDDLILYATAAYILDQEDVIERVIEIRKYWNIKTNIPQEEFDIWIKYPPVDLCNTPEAARELDYALERLEIDAMQGNLSESEKLLRERDITKLRVLDYEIKYSLRKLNISFVFERMLLKAIICGKVDKEDIKIQKNFYEILKSFKAKQYRQIGTNINNFEKNWLFESIMSSEPKIAFPVRKRFNIKRDRNWYHLNQSGLSYGEIAKRSVDRGRRNVEEYRENIHVQVSRYKQFLKG